MYHHAPKSTNGKPNGSTECVIEDDENELREVRLVLVTLAAIQRTVKLQTYPKPRTTGKHDASGHHYEVVGTREVDVE